MVVALGPGKFYGSSLPRPRIYTDVKFNDERVDPPVPVIDPLMTWAQEAHWSMGGLSFRRLRLQGRIEGNVRSSELSVRKSSRSATTAQRSSSPSPPPAPMAVKRRRYVAPMDEEDEEEEVEDVLDREERGEKCPPTRNLAEGSEAVAAVRTRNQRSKESGNGGNTVKKVEDDTSKANSTGKKLKRGGKSEGVPEGPAASPAGSSSGTRTSPRLGKRG
ncbi:hypothetical protein NMG60_11002995, partial [Bertholletia excelsa]